MIEHTLDTAHGILYLRPKSALEEADFLQLAGTVDPFIEKTGRLAGLIIEAPRFFGWDSLGAMVAHFRFARDHHRQIRRVALVTDSALGDVAEKLVGHFAAAEIRHFARDQLAAAELWIKSGA